VGCETHIGNSQGFEKMISKLVGGDTIKDFIFLKYFFVVSFSFS